MKNYLSTTFKGLLAVVAMVALICIVMQPETYSPFSLALVVPFMGRIKKSLQKGKARKMVDLDVEFISLVDVPANDLPVIMKNADGKTAKIKFDMKIVSKDVKKGLVYGTVYEPDAVDLQADFTDEAEITKAAHKFMLKSRQGNVDVQHNLEKGAGTVVESFIKKGDHEHYPGIKDGAWCVAIKLSDSIMPFAEQIKGLSMYGKSGYDLSAEAPQSKAADGAGDGFGQTLQKIRVTAGVGDTDMATALGLSHDDYMSYENGADGVSFKWTEEAIGAAAKKVKMTPQAFSAALLNGGDDDDAGKEPSTDDNPAAATGADTMPQTSIDNGANQKSVQPNKKNMSKTITAEKKILKSGVLPVPDGENSRLFATVKDHKSPETQRQLMKSIIGYTDDARERMSKGNEVLSTDFGDFESTNVLNPELADSLLSIVVDQSDFLKQIQTKSITRRDAEIDVMDIAPRSLTRIAGGTAPGTGNGARPINRSIQVHTAEVDLKVSILNKTIRENGNLAALEASIFNNFTVAFKNDITDLGWNGTSDGDGSTFLNCKRGWLTLLARAYASDATSGVPTAQNISVAGSGLDITDMETIFKTMKKAGIDTNPRFGWDDHTFFTGPTDMQAYRNQLKDRPDGLVALAVTEGNVPKWDGNPIVKNNFIATKAGVLTKPQNLGLAVLRGDGAGEDGIIMQRNVVQKGIELIMTLQLDYFIVNPLDAVLLRA